MDGVLRGRLLAVALQRGLLAAGAGRFFGADAALAVAAAAGGRRHGGGGSRHGSVLQVVLFVECVRNVL